MAVSDLLGTKMVTLKSCSIRFDYVHCPLHDCRVQFKSFNQIGSSWGLHKAMYRMTKVVRIIALMISQNQVLIAKTN